MLTLPHMAALTTLYCEPHRGYHNLSHIQNCLREVDYLKKEKIVNEADANTLEISIWFHDAVYDPKSVHGVNERRSARLMRQTLVQDMHYRFLDLSLVETMILATAHHYQEPEYIHARERRELLHYFLDIDLSILGADRDTYMEYAKGVAKEYSFAPVDVYIQKREEVLSAFLKRHWLFYTDRYKKTTAVAKENMEFEIKYNKHLRW